MAERKVYLKSAALRSDFVYVDLLPDLKRTRQFNVNVLFTLLFAVLLTYFIIYLPYRNVSDELSELNGLNNDLNYALILANEERRGYEINTDIIAFQTDLYIAENLQVDINKYIKEVDDEVTALGGDSRSFIYDLDENELVVIVGFSDYYTTFQTLNDNLIDNLDWIVSSPVPDPIQTGIVGYYKATYRLGVDYNAE